MFKFVVTIEGGAVPERVHVTAPNWMAALEAAALKVKRSVEAMISVEQYA